MSWDLETEEGVKIEVKTSGYLQRWHGGEDKESIPEFGIRKVRVYCEKTKAYSEEKSRPADVYVFCLHIHRDSETIDPMKEEQWEFYVLPTKVLDHERPSGKTIRLDPLIGLGAKQVRYSELGEAIRHAGSR